MMSLNLVFKALNDKTRRDILELLRKKEMTAGEIAEKFSISAPSISHHLEILKRAQLIESEKRGQFIIYSLNTTVLDDMIKWAMQLGASKK
jgi:DNA-binding transcriptional ArsR family regulator